jgi:hypothetical protein
MDASRNQGKALNETNLSFSAISSQNPYDEMLVTSTSKMFLPRFADFTFVLPNGSECPY